MAAKKPPNDFPTRPIRPNEVDKTQVIPGVVFQCFNELIARHINMGVATIKQDDVVKLIVKAGISKKKIFDNKYLDVESAYKEAGWKVEYDKPGFNETPYPPTFKFSTK